MIGLSSGTIYMLAQSLLALQLTGGFKKGGKIGLLFLSLLILWHMLEPMNTELDLT